MADEKPNWQRDPEYRSIHSNFFKLRCIPQDATVTFCEFSATPDSLHYNVLKEQISVSLSWPQLKLLGMYIEAFVKEMEKEAGPIISYGHSKEELQKQAAEILKTFGIRR
jgi:hypothetical protein